MKITLNNISTQNSVPTASATINNNNDAIETAFENTLSRDGTSPNQMGANIDINSHRILNLPAPVTADEPLRYQDLSTFVGGGTVTNIPAGGHTNDVLTKTSNTDYAVDWIPSNPGVVTAGTNIAITGTSPATVSTVQNPNFTTSVTTPSLVLNGTTINSKTGSGAVVLGTSPTIATPVINGLPAGTGVATANTVSTLVSRDASGNFAAGTITAALSGNATTATSATSATTATNATNTAITEDTTTNTSMFPTWVTANTGNLPQKTTSTKLSFNPSTGALSSTSFTGAGTGLTGTAASLTAGNVTTNANLTGPITSVGNATTIAASPALTGTPTTTTAAVDTNTTQIASTAFVLAQAGSATPLIDGSATVGTSTRFARQDHIHPTDTTRAALASPTFTGTPAAPTAAVDTNTTQLATTAMVLAQAASATPVNEGYTGVVGTSTRFARADHVHAISLTTASNILGSNVLLNNTANFFDGPSMAQGTSGIWFVIGTVSLYDSTGSAAFWVKLWDGTTVIAAGTYTTIGSSSLISATLSGIITNPVANLRISARDTTTVNGTMQFNNTGTSKDCSIYGFRIG